MSDNSIYGPSRAPEGAVAALVHKLTLGTPGVHGMGAKKARGIRVAYDDESGYTIDVYLVVDFGVNIPETAWNVQKNAYDGLKSKFGIEPADINIHVQGVYTEL